MKIESKTVHWGDRRKAGNFTPVTTPIYTASSYVYESMDQLDRVFGLEESGPSYARYDNPTRSALEELVRELESGTGSIACASGMVAIHTALLAALLDRPKHVVAANMMYGATTGLLMNVLAPMGVETTHVDVCDLDAVQRLAVLRIRLPAGCEGHTGCGHEIADYTAEQGVLDEKVGRRFVRRPVLALDSERHRR